MKSMKIAAHPIQRRILEWVNNCPTGYCSLSKISLREIAKIVGETSPQKIKHHLNQMVKWGFLDVIDGSYQVGKYMVSDKEDDVVDLGDGFLPPISKE